MKIIAITGMPGSGKEEFVNVAKNMGLTVVRMGDVIRQEVKNRGLELTDTNVGRIAHEEREKHGYGVWADRTVPLIQGDEVIIDGMRGEAELEVFKRAYGDDLVVVSINSSPETRYNRIKTRKRKDATMNREAFLKREQRELGWGIEKVIKMADHTIENEGTLEEFQDKVRKLLETLSMCA